MFAHWPFLTATETSIFESKCLLVEWRKNWESQKSFNGQGQLQRGLLVRLKPLRLARIARGQREAVQMLPSRRPMTDREKGSLCWTSEAVDTFFDRKSKKDKKTKIICMLQLGIPINPRLFTNWGVSLKLGLHPDALRRQHLEMTFKSKVILDKAEHLVRAFLYLLLGIFNNSELHFLARLAILKRIPRNLDIIWFKRRNGVREILQKALALHTSNLSLIPRIPHGPQSLTRIL